MPSCIQLLALLSTAYMLALIADAKAVFCHYIVGTVNPDHVAQDVANAKAIGFDAFALDLLQPLENFTTDTTASLFSAAENAGFKLFFSMDLANDGTIGDFTDLLNQYISHPSYYKGPDGHPFLSTYSAATLTNTDLENFLGSLSSDVYFVPNFETQGYYDDPDSYWGYWGPYLQGTFSWETAWPPSTDAPTNVTTARDVTVQNGANKYKKSYMIPMSSLQYKHLSGLGNYYRIGEVNLPQRMDEILGLDHAPDFVEVITYNDAGESHYVGNIWPEGLSSDELVYANQTAWDHSAWQPLITSFINTWKAGGSSSTMSPPNESPIGAMWYHTLLVSSASCSNDPLGKPEGFISAVDAVNFALVLPSGLTGYTIKVSSGGDVLQSIPAKAGLNYACIEGLKTGSQLVELLDESGTVIGKASSEDAGAIPVYTDAGASGGICNLNYQVVGLTSEG